MNVQQGNSQANPQGGQFAGESGNESTDINELDGLLGDIEGGEEDLLAADDEEQQPDDGAQPDGDQADDAPDGEGDTPDVKAVTDEAEVPLDDGRKVTVRELKETFSTFQRKTSEMAETQRNTLAQAREAVANYAQTQAQELHLISQRIEQLVVPGIDEAALQRLAYENPEQFYQVKARLDMAREMRTNIQQQVSQLVQQAQTQREQAAQEQQQAHQQLLQAEGAKLQAQKWFNADFQAKAVAFAKKHGLPEQVAKSVAYAGFVEITRKAMLYDEAMARTKGGKQLPKQSTTTPGASPARGAMHKAKQISGSFERAKQTGDRTDIGRFLDQVLPP